MAALPVPHLLSWRSGDDTPLTVDARWYVTSDVDEHELFFDFLFAFHCCFTNRRRWIPFSPLASKTDIEGRVEARSVGVTVVVEVEQGTDRKSPNLKPKPPSATWTIVVTPICKHHARQGIKAMLITACRHKQEIATTMIGHKQALPTAVALDSFVS